VVSDGFDLKLGGKRGGSYRLILCAGETVKLLDLGKEGGYIFPPDHDVLKDVPLENMLAFTETVPAQSGHKEA
jgi:hypothetical protein